MKAKPKANSELIYVIAGEEQTLVNSRYCELIDRLIPPEERDTGLLVADTDRITIAEVLDELRTLPFLTKKRVVVVRDADDFISEKDEEEEQKGKHARLSNRELLERYFDNPCPTGILVMTVKSWPGNTKLAKKLPAAGRLIEVEAPRGKELMRLVIKCALDKYEKRLDYNAAQLLVELTGEDITRLYTEIDKLAVYAADEKSITTAHIEALVGFNRMFNAFAVIDACLQKKTAEAVERLRKMFAEDKNADYTTVGALAFHFRRLFTAKKMLEKGVPQDVVSKQLRMWSYSQFDLLRRLTYKQIGEQLKRLAETDYAIKKGQAQPRVAIEQMVLKMATM